MEPKLDTYVYTAYQDLLLLGGGAFASPSGGLYYVCMAESMTGRESTEKQPSAEFKQVATVVEYQKILDDLARSGTKPAADQVLHLNDMKDGLAPGWREAVLEMLQMRNAQK